MGKNSIKNTKTKLVLGGVIAAVLASLTVATLNLPSQMTPSQGQYGAVVYPGNLNTTVNGCGDVFRFSTNESLYGVIPQEAYATAQTKTIIPTHPMIVPVYGYMSDRGLKKNEVKFYERKGYPDFPRQQILRTMWDDNTTVIWYDENATAADVFRIKKYTTEHTNVLAVPWTGVDALPMNRHIAFSTWGISQSCNTFDNSVLNDFQNFKKVHPVKHTVTPPVKKLNKFGLLSPINPGVSYKGKDS